MEHLLRLGQNAMEGRVGEKRADLVLDGCDRLDRRRGAVRHPQLRRYRRRRCHKRCATRFAHTPDWLPSSINFGEMRVLFAKKDDKDRIKSACALLQRDRTAALYRIIALGL